MEGTRKWKEGSFLKILLAVMAVLAFAVSSVQANVTVPAGQEWDINYDAGGFLLVYGTANLDAGFYAANGIYAFGGSTVNIRGGNIGVGVGVRVLAGPPAAAVTVYGTNFAVTTGTIVDGSWTPSGGSGTLTGDYGNGDPINLLFYSDVPIYLSVPGVTNQPPIAIAGQEGLIGAGGKIHPIYSSEQDVTIVLGQASDPEEEPIEYQWRLANALPEDPNFLDWTLVAIPPAAYLDLSAQALFSLGDHTLVLKVREVSGDKLWSTDDMILRILNSPPSASANPTSMTVGIGDPISIGAEVADFDGDLLTYDWRKSTIVIASGTATPPPGGDYIPINALMGTGGTAPFELGLNELEIAVSDGVNPAEVVSVTVEVVDTEAPTLAPVASQTMLWPPNHQLIPITILANAVDNSGDPLTLNVEVTSNEPDEDDWVIESVDNTTGEIQLRLRAERSGSGDGRVYTVTITATDEANNSSTAIVEIRVPHDRRKK